MLQIRAEKSPDAAGIRAVHLAAFAPHGNEAGLVDLLRQAGQTTISLVAISDGRLAGHVLFSPLTLAPARPKLRGLGLAPLAVLPEFRRQGIGSQLVLRGLEVCRAATYDFVAVLGDPPYYSRFGFRPARQFHLDNEYGAMDTFMAVELHAGALAGAAGLVQYRPEFRESGC
jgi:putative acetyltransferase